LAANLAPARTVGRVVIYDLAPNAKTLAAYRAAGASRPNAERASALAGLAFAARRSGRFDEAAADLEKAKLLAPTDPKIRYQLGLTRYLAFDDRRASTEFAWCVEHDTQNIHAQLFYGDALAGRDRSDEALRAYGFYFGAKQFGGFWTLQPRAQKGIDAVRRKAAACAPGDGSLLSWSKVAQDCFVRGSFERAAEAERVLSSAADALKLKPLPIVFLNLAQIEDASHHYAAAAEALGRGVAAGGGNDFKIRLARELALKRDWTQARRLVDEVLSKKPGDPQAQNLQAELNRL
jgi:tetratricopeptide (TPR) repeat protein